MEYEPTIDVLISLCGQSVLEHDFLQNRRHPVREILDTASGKIRLRSSIAGQYILTQFADPNALVGVLMKMAKAADAFAGNNPLYFELLKSFTRFNGLQHILPERDRRKAVIRYYESIKNPTHTAKQPLFWLQYAIACTVLEEFDRAEAYFFHCVLSCRGARFQRLSDR